MDEMLKATVRIIEIAELVGVSKSRADTLLDSLESRRQGLGEEDRLRAVLVGMLREGTGTPRALHGRDARGAASREMASCAPVDPRPVGSVCLRFETCLAPMAVQQVPAKSTGLAAVDQETQESLNALCSRLERYEEAGGASTDIRAAIRTSMRDCGLRLDTSTESAVILASRSSTGLSAMLFLVPGRENWSS
jgi:hypothetical protein